MLHRLLCQFLLLLLTVGAVSAATTDKLLIRTAKPGATVKIDRILKDGSALISVVDAEKNPVFNLTAADFSVSQSGRKANILALQPFSESLDVPRHIVMVLDNSYSMYERNAIKSLLAGVDSLLKIVRPIDKVYLIVFEDNMTTEIAGRKLHVRQFQSSKPGELRDYVGQSYSQQGLTAGTMLYEAMLAGTDVIGSLPAGEPRFLVIFSDGEDINSSFKPEVVLQAADKLAGFSAYAVDYMPGTDTNKFLAGFAAKHDGQIWKATSEANLVPIFESVASRMQYNYILNYQFPPTGALVAEPEGLQFDRISTDTTPSPAPAKEAAAPPVVIDSSGAAPALLLRPVVDTVYGIASWKATVSNDKGVVASQSGEGAPPAELKIALPATDLAMLTTGGDLTARVELQDRKGQNLALTAPPVKPVVTPGRASLAVSPAVLTIDQVQTATLNAAIDTTTLNLRPMVAPAYWVARWQATVSNSQGPVASKSGEGAPPEQLQLSLLSSNVLALAAGGDLNVKMELQGRNGQNLLLTTPAVKIMTVKTSAALGITPAGITVEEVKTIDASPMLGQLFFAKGSSDIASQYVRFADAAATAGFDEQKFRDTLEKYYQLLNIVGKRLVDNPTATVRLVGCNDNVGEEKGKKKLSTARAEAVRNYLQTVWNIAPERLTVEARNLPALPSTSRSAEGQAENRRVEIQASDPAILAPIRSTYIATRIDNAALNLKPEVTAPYGIASWKVTAGNGAGKLAELSGQGDPAKETKIPLPGSVDLRAMATGGDIAVKMELQDRKGQSMTLTPPPVKMTFIETSKRLAQKQDQKVQEKYALILFDFDKDTISGPNQEIVNRIVARIKALPQASVDIVGHTDNIGKEAYNVKLSERRALAVDKLLLAAYGEPAGERIKYSGVGPNSPLYDNQTPEGRSFNRTVTITLEYLSAE